MSFLNDLIDKYDIFLFDFDGVVVQSESIKFLAYQSAFKNYFSLEIDNAEMAWVGLSEEDVVEFYFHRYNLKGNKKSLIQFKRNWYINYLQSPGVPLNFGVKTFLENLCYNKKKKALVTSSKRVDVEKILVKHNLESFFNFLICAEDVERRKPDPQPYILAMKKFGIVDKEAKKKVIIFEDSFVGLDAGLASGADVVGFSESAEGYFNKEKLQALIMNF